MERVILAAYSGLTVTSLIAFLISAIILEKCIRQRNFSSTFLISLSMALCWLGEFINRLWWTVWKGKYVSREPSAWMYDHVIVLISSLLMIASGIILIKSLTYEVADKRVFLFTAVTVIYVTVLVYIMR